jgi:hypothetical protein
MQRLTISLPHELLANLRLMAAERGVSMAAIVREALEEKTRARRPKPTFIGIADSGYTDTSELLSKGSPPPVSWR